MSCTTINRTNKNAVNRLNQYATSGTSNVKYLVYIRGNANNPLGVLERLTEYGGTGGVYTTADLMNEHNIFYIDYKNGSTITFIPDTDMVAEAILSCWDELYAQTPKSYSPDDWEVAVIDYPAAALFDSGKDEQTNAEIQIVGRLKVLRDIYRKGWEPSAATSFYYIGYRNNALDKGKGSGWSRFLSFQDSETRNLFYDNYKTLIEQVKTYI